MKSRIDPLEPRRLLTVAPVVVHTITPTLEIVTEQPVEAHLSHTGTLVINGTTKADKIFVRNAVQLVGNKDDMATYTVTPIIGVTASGFNKTFDGADVKRI